MVLLHRESYQRIPRKQKDWVEDNDRDHDKVSPSECGRVTRVELQSWYMYVVFWSYRINMPFYDIVYQGRGGWLTPSLRLSIRFSWVQGIIATNPVCWLQNNVIAFFGVREPITKYFCKRHFYLITLHLRTDNKTERSPSGEECNVPVSDISFKPPIILV